jgi:cysteinyl-tRNA synthetase
LLNKIIDKKGSDSEQLLEAISNFYFILNLLGFKFNLAPYNSETKLLIKNWQELRKKGDYQQADKIRKKLQEMNVV